MVEQYLYSRSSNKKQNSQGDIIEEGFGAIAKTAGLSAEDIKKLEVFGNDYYPTVTDENGNKPGVFMKYCLDNKQKDLVFAKTASIEQPQRMAHISHQIVFRNESKKQVLHNIVHMLNLDFIDRDVDNEDIILNQTGDIPSLPNVSVNVDLRDVLESWDLTPDSFWKIITAVFDCVQHTRKIIFLVDYTQHKLWDNIKNLLYHIYRYLPIAYREIVGFDSCYSKNSNKSCIHICFADASLAKKVSKTLYKFDQKNCLYDYVIENGQIIHTVDPEKPELFSESNMFLKEIQLKIGDELIRKQHNRDLDSTFFQIYTVMLDGSNSSILTQANSYSSVSVINQINSGRKISRQHAITVIEKYLEITQSSFLIKDDIWISAIQNYFTIYEKDNSDDELIDILIRMYNESQTLNNFAFALIRLKLQNDLKQNGISEIDRYSKAINKIKSEKNKELIASLFHQDQQISKWYVHYSFKECDSARVVMEKVITIITESDQPDKNFLVSVTKEILSRVQSITLDPEDIQQIYDAVTVSKDPYIWGIFVELFEEIMRKVDYTEQPVQWFKTLPVIEGYTPKSNKSLLAYLVKDVLDDPSETNLMDYINRYSKSITRKNANTLLAQLTEILNSMFLDGRIPLEKDNFALTLLTSTSNEFIDVTMLGLILCEYPDQIKDYLLWFAEEYSSYPLPKEEDTIDIPATEKTSTKKDKKNTKLDDKQNEFKDDTYYIDALLYSVKECITKPISTNDAKDINLCVDILMEQKLVGVYGEQFMSDFYSFFVDQQKGIKKVFYKLRKEF